MIYFKTQEEIEILHQGGKILAGILNAIADQVKPGTSTLKLEELSLALIAKAGGRPAFLNYDMGDDVYFPSSLCISINEEVVHGTAVPDRILQEGDIVGLDIGMEWPLQTKEEALANNRPYNSFSPGGGFYTDTCKTVPVGKVSAEATKLLRVTREALEIGISKAVAGNTINDVGQAIEDYVKKHKYTAVRDLVGHGVGYFAHEAPNVFNYRINPKDPENIVLQPGMVIAIEPMINEGRFNVKTLKNGYTFITSDKSLSAHFEHSIAILEKGNLILTKI